MRWLLCALLFLATTDAEAARQRGAGEELLRVVSPPSRNVASAHPHVNVLVTFGTAKDGTAADPSTFRAKLNGQDVTRAFTPTLTGDVPTGLRAELPQASVRLANSPRNRLRLSIQAVKSQGGGKRARDVDRVRFGAADTPNQPPIATIAADRDIVSVGVPVTFDASGSHDPDFDELEFHWSFSDGEAATGATVTHAFTSAADAASATVRVSDGIDEASQSVSLPAALSPDPGRTAGVLRVEAKALEFSAVATGASATRSLTVKNTDDTATSQVKIHATLQGGAGFAVAPADVDLGPGASATIDLTFAPAADGHASAQLMLVTSASNRPGVTYLTHGYGGTAPGDGPTLVDAPVFAALGTELDRIGSDGSRVSIDASTGTCAPPGASFGGDMCAVEHHRTHGVVERRQRQHPNERLEVARGCGRFPFEQRRQPVPHAAGEVAGLANPLAELVPLDDARVSIPLALEGAGSATSVVESWISVGSPRTAADGTSVAASAGSGGWSGRTSVAGASSVVVMRGTP